MLGEPEVLHEIVRRFGVKALYNECAFSGDYEHSAATALLDRGGRDLIPPAVGEAIAVTMTSLPRPWGDAELFDTLDLDTEDISAADSLRMLLTLPLFENLNHRDKPSWPDHDRVPEAVRDFIEGWKAGEINVTEPRQPQPHQSPEPH